MNSNDIIKNLIKDEAIAQLLMYGFDNRLILPWDEEFRKKLIKLNVYSGFSFSFWDVFKYGANIGTCYGTARSLSFLFKEFELQTGFLPILAGTPGSISGEHCWLKVDDYIYDTTLMLKVHVDFADKLGYRAYKTETQDEFFVDPMYQIQREQSVEDNSWYFEHMNVMNRFVRARLDN